ncbi:MAG: hypothetical protein FWE11_01300 [Defluviitaleaceae bacterium]|nr:hypothetical protein [Defluviitaleaceae bacterium]
MLNSIVSKLNYDFLRGFGDTRRGAPLLKIGIAGLPASGKTSFTSIALETLQNPRQTLGGVYVNFLAGLNEPDAIYNDPPPEYKDIAHSIFIDRIPSNIKDSPYIEDRQVSFTHSDKGYELSFLEANGEDFARNSISNEFFEDSEAFILTIDPLNIPEIRYTLKDHGFDTNQHGVYQGRDPSVTKPITEAIYDFAIRANIKNKPIAIVFTKFDLLFNCPYLKQNHLASASNIYKPFAYVIENGTVSLNRLKESSREIEMLLTSFNLTALTTLVSDISNKHMYFAVSGYGHTPSGANLGEIRPHRVLDPLLWLLKLRGFV